jgi:purine-binding chemotaxis protein CheW
MSDKNIDWNAIRQRLESTGAALKEGFSPGPDERKRILKARADVLAREPEEITSEGSIEVTEFLLANEYYAIESCYIREVCPIKDYTPLPGTPPFVLGLINVRGQIVSVINIKKFFDLPDKGISDLNKVIIIHNETMEFSILADAILGVRSIATTEIQPPLPTLTGIREEYLKGVTGDRIVVLDAGRLLADKKIVVDENI